MIKKQRRLLNCWLVAMFFWGRSWCAYPVAIRRSHAFVLVPHFIATLPGRWRHFHAVEYIPPRRRRWTLDDFVLLFRGRYRVTEYRAVSVHWFDSREDLLAHHERTVGWREKKSRP